MIPDGASIWTCGCVLDPYMDRTFQVYLFDSCTQTTRINANKKKRNKKKKNDLDRIRTKSQNLKSKKTTLPGNGAKNLFANMRFPQVYGS